MSKKVLLVLGVVAVCFAVEASQSSAGFHHRKRGCGHHRGRGASSCCSNSGQVSGTAYMHNTSYQSQAGHVSSPSSCCGQGGAYGSAYGDTNGGMQGVPGNYNSYGPSVNVGGNTGMYPNANGSLGNGTTGMHMGSPVQGNANIGVNAGAGTGAGVGINAGSGDGVNAGAGADATPLDALK